MLSNKVQGTRRRERDETSKHGYEFMNRRSRAYEMGVMAEYDGAAARTNRVLACVRRRILM